MTKGEERTALKNEIIAKCYEAHQLQIYHLKALVELEDLLIQFHRLGINTDCRVLYCSHCEDLMVHFLKANSVWRCAICNYYGGKRDD